MTLTETSNLWKDKVPMKELVVVDLVVVDLVVPKLVVDLMV